MPIRPAPAHGQGDELRTPDTLPRCAFQIVTNFIFFGEKVVYYLVFSLFISEIVYGSYDDTGAGIIVLMDLNDKGDRAINLND